MVLLFIRLYLYNLCIIPWLMVARAEWFCILRFSFFVFRFSRIDPLLSMLRRKESCSLRLLRRQPSHDYLRDKDPRPSFLHLSTKAHTLFSSICFGLQEVYNCHHEGPGVSSPHRRMRSILSHAASATSTTRCPGVVVEASSEPPRILKVAYKGGSRRMG